MWLIVPMKRWNCGICKNVNRISYLEKRFGSIEDDIGDCPEVFILPIVAEGHSLKEPYRRYLNESSS